MNRKNDSTEIKPYLGGKKQKCNNMYNAMHVTSYMYNYMVILPRIHVVVSKAAIVQL